MKNGSKARASVAASMPWPVSATVRRTNPPASVRMRRVESASPATGSPDSHELLGKVKSKAFLAELGAEILETSMILGDNAYDVVPGFVGAPIGTFADHQRGGPPSQTRNLTTDEDLLAATRRGIRKVNIGTQLNLAFTRAVTAALVEKTPRGGDPRVYIGAGREAIAQQVERVLRLLAVESAMPRGEASAV